MTITNFSGIELPKHIEGYGDVSPFKGSFTGILQDGACFNPQAMRYTTNTNDKIQADIKTAVKSSGLKDGMTISFHHHLRGGDTTVNAVLQALDEMGFKDLTLNASSVTSAMDILSYVKTGLITAIDTSGLRGKIAKPFICEEIKLKRPIVFRSHGGRARAIESGDVKIDVTFIATPACDKRGNMNGFQGKSAFGAMGYPMVDAKYARKVIAITDNLMPYPLTEVHIPQTQVDYVVVVDNIGDSEKIGGGATRMTNNPTELLIAKKAANVLIGSGAIKNDFSFQAGSGGSALAVSRYIKDYMHAHNIVGSFTAGGISSTSVELFEEGLFKAIIDVQTFDGPAATSYERNKGHHLCIDASMYASPYNGGCMAHEVDVMILSATEIDLDFNVNSLTGSTGGLLGAIGGAQDTGEGSKLTVIVAPAMRKRNPIIVDKVHTIITPGCNVDIVVTDRGIAINPKRTDIMKKLDEAHIDYLTIQELQAKIEKLTTKPKKIEQNGNIIGIIEYRDGTVLDLIRSIKE